MQVAERRQDLRAPPPPGLQRQPLHVALGALEELLQGAGAHVLRDEDDARLVVVRVRPVAVELDNVRVLQLRQVLKHLLDLLLLRLEVSPLAELHLVPHHLHALLCVHGQMGTVDSRHIALLHLGVSKRGRLIKLISRLEWKEMCLDFRLFRDSS